MIESPEICRGAFYLSLFLIFFGMIIVSAVGIYYSNGDGKRFLFLICIYQMSMFVVAPFLLFALARLCTAGAP